MFHAFLYNVVVPKFQEMHPDVWAMSSPKHPNRQGSFLSFIYQCVECKVLLHAKDFCASRDIKVAVLMYDGMMVRASDQINEQFMADLGAYTLEKTGFDIKWAEKPIVAPCAIPEPEEEEDEKTPEEEISEFIINEFETKGYAKDGDTIYAASEANPFYYEPLMTVAEYTSYLLDEVFIRYFNKNAHNIPRSEYDNLDLGPYRDVLDLQMGEDPEAIKQYIMLAFGRSCFPVGELDNWRLCLITWGESGTGKTLTMDLLKEIHGIQRMSIMESGAKMTPYTIGYVREKPFWILQDVDKDVIAKLGQSLFKNASEGGGLMGGMKHRDEDTKQFTTHIMMTLNYLVQFQEESGEISTRMVIAHFKNKPARKDDKIFKRIVDKYLINIIVTGLSAYHSTLDHLDANPEQTFRDDVLSPFFKQSNEQARVLNDVYGKAILAQDSGFVVTQDPADYVGLDEIQNAGNVSISAKWNDELMAAIGLKADRIKT
ncbi:hypothetical protein H9P43_002717 [Blastocladiella emersonii ATCC 22665]|nr:hypothetical protein H9P43_002717 [Blastocladiella emersonii ATCC 22665]